MWSHSYNQIVRPLLRGLLFLRDHGGDDGLANGHEGGDGDGACFLKQQLQPRQLPSKQLLSSLVSLPWTVQSTLHEIELSDDSYDPTLPANFWSRRVWHRSRCQRALYPRFCSCSYSFEKGLVTPSPYSPRSARDPAFVPGTWTMAFDLKRSSYLSSVESMD